MGVEGSRISLFFRRFALNRLNDIAKAVGHDFVAFGFSKVVKFHHRTVVTPPVINILSPAPLALEGLLTLAHRLRIIEVPQPLLTGRRLRGGLRDIILVAFTGPLLESLLNFLLFL